MQGEREERREGKRNALQAEQKLLGSWQQYSSAGGVSDDADDADDDCANVAASSGCSIIKSLMNALHSLTTTTMVLYGLPQRITAAAANGRTSFESLIAQSPAAAWLTEREEAGQNVGKRCNEGNQQWDRLLLLAGSQTATATAAAAATAGTATDSCSGRSAPKTNLFLKGAENEAISRGSSAAAKSLLRYGG